ncbi:HEAT repeat domain-containing protein [Taklimakanibacter deserti]|uniref:HEAT repeat domain-containing protein n=1 Tax=Taklimakanibacter deserti TaxID=2267839 RepID=UPI000E655C14
MATSKKDRKAVKKKRPVAARQSREKPNVFLEIEALSTSKPHDRLRLASLARKARHQVHRSDALQKLRKRFDKVLIDALPIALVDRGELVRVEALEIIAEHALSSFESASILALKDKHPLVQDRAVWALAEIKTPTAIKAVKRFLPRAPGKAGVAAEAFLYTIDWDARRVDRLLAFLQNDDQSVRRASSTELAYIVRKQDMERTIEAIKAAISREQYRVVKLHHRRQIRYLRSRFAS